MTLANGLTLLRIFLVPVFMTLLLVHNVPAGDFLAACVFVAAAITDGLDGYVARRRQEVTRFGKLVDPIADKLLISAALLSLVQLGRISAWVAFIIIGREFAISGLRILAAAEGVVLAASSLGKLKTVLQICAVVVLIFNWPGGSILIWLAAFVTLVSGITYVLSSQDILRDIK